MHHLDELTIRLVINQLEKAADALKAGGFANELLVALHLSFAKTDLEGLLKIQTKETV